MTQNCSPTFWVNEGVKLESEHPLKGARIVPCLQLRGLGPVLALPENAAHLITPLFKAVLAARKEFDHGSELLYTDKHRITKPQ